MMLLKPSSPAEMSQRESINQLLMQQQEESQKAILNAQGSQPSIFILSAARQ